LCYSMLVVFGTTSPFLIEHVFHFSPVVSGYAALLSGVALMTGGIISKSMLSKPLDRKIQTAVALQIIFALIMIGVNRLWSNIYTLMAFVVLIHLLAGFIFNNLFAYALGRFTQNAGIASGVTGGGNYVFTSLFTFTITGLFHFSNTVMLGIAYLLLAVLLLGTFILFKKARTSKTAAQPMVQANRA
ncbi:MAG TPA: MFS transporter, partial [Puia sp.]